MLNEKRYVNSLYTTALNSKKVGCTGTDRYAT